MLAGSSQRSLAAQGGLQPLGAVSHSFVEVLQTWPLAQSLSARQATQVLVALSQRGAPLGQSASMTHSTQVFCAVQTWLNGQSLLETQSTQAFCAVQTSPAAQSLLVSHSTQVKVAP